MLPTPPISVWSSSARLTSVCRRRRAALNASASNDGSSGSMAMCASRGGMPSPVESSTARPPKVRWSTKRSSRPPSVKVNRARRCVSSGCEGFSTSSWPLMPRWATSARSLGVPSGSASGSHRYLPRRWAAVNVRPVSACTKWSAPSRCRRTARGGRTSTAARGRPVTHWSRPRRTTSTSGSSGTGSALRGQGPPRGLGGLLLGGLLRAAGALAVDRAGQEHGGGEGLGVVGSVVLDRVPGRAEPAGGGELLQAGLPVQAGAAGRGLDQQRVEQPVHDLCGGVQPAAEVDRAEQRLEGVGEDRVLLPAAGRLLAAAEQQVRADAAVAERAGYPGE